MGNTFFSQIRVDHESDANWLKPLDAVSLSAHEDSVAFDKLVYDWWYIFLG
jgi:hypothetical protein